MLEASGMRVATGGWASCSWCANRAEGTAVLTVTELPRMAGRDDLWDPRGLVEDIEMMRLAELMAGGLGEEVVFIVLL